MKPSDIGILVRKNKQGKAIKNALAKYGVPAVTIGDAKVLESEEAVDVLYLLQAMADITRANINKCLLCSFTGYKAPQVLTINDETAIALFKKYKTTWDSDGIYTALNYLISDFGVQEILLNRNSENGERIITNLYQLMELLYKVQTTKKLSPIELIDWLNRGIESDNSEGDEYEQRIENDEEAVKIVTIHKSKGLEYNIVLAPFLDFVEWKEETFCNYRNDKHEYINLKKKHASEEQLILYRKQSEQENRRLVYVAITRAVYKCFIFKITDSYYKKSTLTYFYNALQNIETTLIDYPASPAIPEKYLYKSSAPENVVTDETIVDFTLLQENWTRMSYSGLAAEKEKSIKIKTGEFNDDYSNFIFNQLVKGNKTGSMLHYIFENIHFTDNIKWPGIIGDAVKQFNPAHKATYEPKLAEMLDHVLNADIRVAGISFHLAEVGYDQRVHEFEFDFPVKLFQPTELESLSTPKYTISVNDRYKLEGMMNGFIDMLFECKGKYFVLDWKSNFLGDAIEQYARAALGEAMNEGNYHLQYLIYTLATKKYLESRLPGFDYERDFGGVLYLFVRGVRKGSSNDIFTSKPSLMQIDALEGMLSGVEIF